MPRKSTSWTHPRGEIDERSNTCCGTNGMATALSSSPAGTDDTGGRAHSGGMPRGGGTSIWSTDTRHYGGGATDRPLACGTFSPLAPASGMRQVEKMRGKFHVSPGTPRARGPPQPSIWPTPSARGERAGSSTRVKAAPSPARGHWHRATRRHHIARYGGSRTRRFWANYPEIGGDKPRERGEGQT